MTHLETVPLWLALPIALFLVLGSTLTLLGTVGLVQLRRLFGYPFLTAHARYVELPLVGKVPAATALVFDLGVYALVMGATVLMLIAIAHQTLRSARLREQDAEEKETERKETP